MAQEIWALWQQKMKLSINQLKFTDDLASAMETEIPLLDYARLFQILITHTDYRRCVTEPMVKKWIQTNSKVQTEQNSRKRKKRQVDPSEAMEKAMKALEIEFDRHNPYNVYLKYPYISFADGLGPQEQSVNTNLIDSHNTRSVLESPDQVLTCTDIDTLAKASKVVLAHSYRLWTTCLQQPLSIPEQMATVLYYFFPQKSFPWTIKHTTSETQTSVTVYLFPIVNAKRTGQVFCTFAWNAEIAAWIAESPLWKYLLESVLTDRALLTENKLGLSELQVWQTMDCKHVWRSDVQLANFLDKECRESKLILCSSSNQLQCFVCTISLHKEPESLFGIRDKCFLYRAIRYLPKFKWTNSGDMGNSNLTINDQLALCSKSEQEEIKEDHNFHASAQSKPLILRVFQHFDELGQVKKNQWKKQEEWFSLNEIIQYIWELKWFPGETYKAKLVDEVLQLAYHSGDKLSRQLVIPYSYAAYCNQTLRVYPFRVKEHSSGTRSFQWFVPRYAIFNLLDNMHTHFEDSARRTVIKQLAQSVRDNKLFYPRVQQGILVGPPSVQQKIFVDEHPDDSESSDCNSQRICKKNGANGCNNQYSFQARMSNE